VVNALDVGYHVSAGKKFWFAVLPLYDIDLWGFYVTVKHVNFSIRKII
jgi:hypothetical protein